MTLQDLATYYDLRCNQCLCMATAKDFYAQGDIEAATFELLNWAMYMDEADQLYALVKPHHATLYCESRAFI